MLDPVVLFDQAKVAEGTLLVAVSVELGLEHVITVEFAVEPGGVVLPVTVTSEVEEHPLDGFDTVTVYRPAVVTFSEGPAGAPLHWNVALLVVELAVSVVDVLVHPKTEGVVTATVGTLLFPEITMVSDTTQAELVVAATFNI